MKQITLEDVNNVILGTDIKILGLITFTDLDTLDLISDLISLKCVGVYSINLTVKQSYIGMSTELFDRFASYIHETWHRNLIESIDIFLTNFHSVQSLEKILIKTFNPELNTVKYKNCSLDNFKSKIRIEFPVCVYTIEINNVRHKLHYSNNLDHYHCSIDSLNIEEFNFKNPDSEISEMCIKCAIYNHHKITMDLISKNIKIDCSSDVLKVMTEKELIEKMMKYCVITKDNTKIIDNDNIKINNVIK